MAKEAEIREMTSRMVPMRRVVRVPYLRVVMVAMGERKRAQEMDSEPTNAYCRYVAPG